jgi:RecA-family ATPase
VKTYTYDADEADYEDEVSQPHTIKSLLMSSAAFVRGFIPPDYLVVGILIKRYLYAMTGRTGSGKTSKALLLTACVAQGIPYGGHKTKKTRVMYAAAENPTDVRMRWIALAAEMGFDPETIDVYFTDQRFSLSTMLDTLRVEAEQFGGNFGLVIVDTSPAFFEGDNENDRAQMGRHAQLLRRIIDVIPGGPCVVANCHPPKNVTDEDLLPAGRRHLLERDRRQPHQHQTQ